MSRVLIVDDSLLQRKMLSTLVTAEGHEAQTACNGKEGLDLILTQPPDCAILDMLMPEMDGIQVLEALQTQGITIPIAVFTADVQEWMRTRCLELGAQHFLNKPVKQEDVRSTLKSLLERSPQETAHAPHS